MFLILLVRAACCWSTVIHFSRRSWKWSNKQRAGESRNRSREIDRAYLKCTEAEAHRNYRESVSQISRALARHERGPRRLSDYLNATICMQRRRRGRTWPTNYGRSGFAAPGQMASRCSPGVDDYFISRGWTHRRGPTALIINRMDHESRINIARTY